MSEQLIYIFGDFDYTYTYHKSLEGAQKSALRYWDKESPKWIEKCEKDGKGDKYWALKDTDVYVKETALLP
jgi:hypothetical protein